MKKAFPLLLALLPLSILFLPACSEKSGELSRPQYAIQAELFPEGNELLLKTEIA